MLTAEDAEKTLATTERLEWESKNKVAASLAKGDASYYVAAAPAAPAAVAG